MEYAELTFRAEQLVFAEFGNPADVLKPEPRDITLLPGEVWVRILASPLNPADLNTIEGTYGIRPALPATPGIEGCGVVENGNGTEFLEGERVMFLGRAAAWASHVAVPNEALFRLPSGIDPLQAALLKVNPATAWQLLHGFRTLQPGDWIVQNLGNSAVGRCVIQLARDLGIRTLSFVRREGLFSELKALGADQVFLDDEGGAAAARDLLGGANAALAFNAVGGESALRLMKLLAEGGTHITYGAMGRKPVTLPNGLLIFRDIRVCGLWVSRWIECAPREEIIAVYEDLAGRVTAGRLVQEVDSVFPLEDFQAALARLDAAERAGKVLFRPVPRA